MHSPAQKTNILILATGGCIAGAVLIRSLLIFFLTINEDEFIHLYWAWAVAQGLVPYRDFMMVHTPLPQWILAPLFWFFKDQVNIIFVTRMIFSLFSVGALLFVYLLAKRIFGKDSALFTLIITLPVAIYTQKSIEVRPDQIAAFLGMATLWFLAKDRPRFFFAGLMSGMAIITNQKFTFMALFLIPGVWLATKDQVVGRLRNSVKFIVALMIPVTGFTIWLAANGALSAFISDNYHVYMFGGNLAGKAGQGLNINRWDMVVELLIQNPTFFMFFGFGAALLIQKSLPRSSRLALRPVLFFLAGLIALYLLTFSHERQNTLYLIPLCAIIAGHGARNIYLKFARKSEPYTRKIILVGLVLFLVLPSLYSMRSLFAETNDDQLKTWKFVLETVPEGQTVMDGHAGMFVYRENALFYHPVAFFDARDILYSFFGSKKSAQEYLAKILSEKKPKLIILEDVFERVLPEVTVEQIKKDYELVEGYTQPLYVLP